MEMSTSTEEPQKIERFDRFRDRKQRNRKVGALLVVATIIIATVVVVTNAFERRDTTIPVTPPSQNERIVFGEQGDTDAANHLFTMNPDGTDVRDLSVYGSCMSRTPDGSKILIQIAGGGFATVNPDGTRYTYTEFAQSGAIGCGALSPDGTRFIRDFGKGMYTARASDGDGLVRLSNFHGMYASYSPDGTQVVFTPEHDRATFLSHRAAGLWVVNADGTGLHLVTHAYAVRPVWSPDGRSILFESYSNRAEIDVVHPDETGFRRITLGSAPGLREAIYPSWSPDGTRFLFVGVTRSGERNLFTARRNGTDVEQITHTHGINYVTPIWGTSAG
jgi:hypothetical protein